MLNQLANMLLPKIDILLGILLFYIFGTFTACSNIKREVRLSKEVPEIDKTREAKVLTAFFGLDNALTQRARALYWNAPGKDGMPLVFSLEIDPKTLNASDFQVTTKDGTLFGVEAVTLLPAEEEFELRTVLLIGEYGNHPNNPPVSVKIVGDLMARAGQNFKGKSIQVIPLEEGPVLSYSEYFNFTEDYPYIEKGTGCDCPKKETQTVVKAVWSGGVRSVNGKELGKNELDKFTIKLLQDKDTISVHPFQIADLDDNDKNTDLCIKEKGIPLHLEVKENTAIDPRDDKNTFTSKEIIGRWK